MGFFQDTEPPRAKRVADLLDTDFPHIASYIEPEIIPKGGTFIFGGEAKIGKSWLMGEFARSTTCKKPPFDYADFYVPEQVRVLVIEQELGERGLKKRLAKIMQNEPRELWEDYLYYESKRPELQLDDNIGKKYFADMIRDVRPNILILDPISMLHGYDENSATDIAELFRTLQKFKQINPEDEMAVVLSHHFVKPPQGKYAEGYDFLSPYNFRGSGKWKDTPDTVCTVSRERNLDTPWESWEIHTRWITRLESSPPDMLLSVNAVADDGRVRFVKTKGKLRKLEAGPHKEITIKKLGELELKQEKFSFNPTK